MAKPIEPTPELTGEDLDRFCRGLKNRRPNEKKAEMLKQAKEFHQKLDRRGGRFYLAKP